MKRNSFKVLYLLILYQKKMDMRGFRPREFFSHYAGARPGGAPGRKKTLGFGTGRKKTCQNMRLKIFEASYSEDKEFFTDINLDSFSSIELVENPRLIFFG